MFNDIKVSVKLIGCIVVISVLVTEMMLTGAKIRMDTVRGLDSIYRQYIETIRETEINEVPAPYFFIDQFLHHIFNRVCIITSAHL